ncbi:hypothetical protein MIMGU_mgv1a026581mg [Erythranthe guttata]|uniref:Kinesin motor domain-containing protein n=1 Tax=Erythranthe guttata TaxID=4155 RepID=A0A022R2N9_ERYGU|nr:hypothetical protein MIMGU_mgv1a026581mg [Erythranthe guttata]
MSLTVTMFVYFSFGQTGSGKTYTVNGPNSSSVVDCGVNYRALNDLFSISQKRNNSYAYEVSVQMVVDFFKCVFFV